MLATQFVLQAHDFLEPMQAPQTRLPADVFSLQDTILHGERAKRRRPRGVTRRGRYDNKVDEDGRPLKGMKRFMLDYTKSTYWTDYITLRDADFYDENPQEDELLRKKFESRIRMPLRMFQNLAREMESDPCMQERRDMAVPLRMKLAASLRFLALGCPWEGLEEIFRVSAQTLRTWFQNMFLPWMMKNKYGLREVPADARRAGQGCRTVHARRVPGHVRAFGWRACQAVPVLQRVCEGSICREQEGADRGVERHG